MKQVNYKEYTDDLNRFIEKHSKKYDMNIWTSPITNGEYRKEYAFEDGNSFYEINNLNYIEEVEVEVKGIKVKVDVKLVNHEYWSSDDSTSKYWYEKI